MIPVDIQNQSSSLFRDDGEGGISVLQTFLAGWWQPCKCKTANLGIKVTVTKSFERLSLYLLWFKSYGLGYFNHRQTDRMMAFNTALITFLMSVTRKDTKISIGGRYLFSR